MPTLVKKYFSLTLTRNLLCLVLLLLALTLGGRRSSANIVAASGNCEDTTIGPAMAFCLVAGECDYPLDYMAWVTMWIGNDTICPNFFPPVVDTVTANSEEGSPGVWGTARSVTVPLGKIVALGIATSQCNGFQANDASYFMANCQGYVPPPIYCFTGCGGGGGSGGCSYCRDNWEWDAQCHDQFDPMCPL